jgi:hypothetical protein
MTDPADISGLRLDESSRERMVARVMAQVGDSSVVSESTAGPSTRWFDKLLNAPLDWEWPAAAAATLAIVASTVVMMSSPEVSPNQATITQTGNVAEWIESGTTPAPADFLFQFASVAQ